MKSKACLILLLLASALLLSACGKGVGARVTSFCDRGTRSVQSFEDAQLITAAEAHDVRAGGEEYVKVENIVAVTKEERA
jgi:predicted small secreted protein